MAISIDGVMTPMLDLSVNEEAPSLIKGRVTIFKLSVLK